jgi:hypothetical protein
MSLGALPEERREGVGGGVAGGEELCLGVFEGWGEDGEEDAAVGATDEIEATFLLDEFEVSGHSG